MLKILNLTKKIKGVKAVNNCSFEIEKHKITALIGPNGSGKTTIFNLISGVTQSDQGKILFNNNDLTNYSIDKISNLGISRLFQQSRLFKNLTVRDNLLLAINNQDTKLCKNIFGLNKDSQENESVVTKILTELDILKIENYITSDLSFGQKRLVEIARSILNPHELLMLDEPIAGINPKIRKNIANLLKKLKKERKTILLIEHDMPFVLSIADNILVLDAGKLIAQGSPSEIRKNKIVINAYLGSD